MGSRLGLVAQKAIEAALGEALLRAPDAGPRLSCAPHDLVGAQPVGGEQDNLGAPEVLLRGVAVCDQCVKGATIGLRNGVEIPLRMRQARTRPSQRESQKGFNCQLSSTRRDGFDQDVIERCALVAIHPAQDRYV